MPPSPGNTPNPERREVTIAPELYDRVLMYRDLIEVIKGYNPDGSEIFEGKTVLEHIIDDAVEAYLDELVRATDEGLPN